MPGYQHRTLNDTPLGESNGLPNQVFRFTQIPFCRVSAWKFVSYSARV